MRAQGFQRASGSRDKWGTTDDDRISCLGMFLEKNRDFSQMRIRKTSFKEARREKSESRQDPRRDFLVLRLPLLLRRASIESREVVSGLFSGNVGGSLGVQRYLL